MQWYYAKGTTQLGPVEETELFRLAKNRELSPDDLVWNSSMANGWVKASTVANLFEEAVSVIPSSPVPPPPPSWQGTESGSFIPGQTPNAELMRMARESLKDSWGIAIGAFLLYLVITGAANGICGLISLVITGPMLVGLYVLYLAIVRKSDARIEMLFAGFKCFGTALGAYLLVLIFVCLWMLLLIVPGIIAAYAYAMTFFILADDPALAPLEAITRSKEMMSGHKWKLFCLGWRFFGWALLCLLTCGIGFIWLFPYMQTAMVHFYEDVRPRKL